MAEHPTPTCEGRIRRNGSHPDEYSDLAAAHRRLAGVVAGLIDVTLDGMRADPIGAATTLDYGDLRELAAASTILLSEASSG